MNWFRNRSAIFKINSLVVLMVISISLTGFIGYYYTRGGNNALTETYQDRFLAIKAINNARAAANASEADVYKFMAADDKMIEKDALNDLIDYSNDVDRQIKAYAETKLDLYEEENLTKIKTILQNYQVERDKAIELGKTEDKLAAYDYFNKNAVSLLDEVNRGLKELADYNAQEANERYLANNESLTWAVKLLILIPVITVLVGLAMGRLVAKMISDPLLQIKEIMAKAEEGDLTIKAEVYSKDETGMLSHSFNNMISRLQSFIAEVQEGAQSVAASSEEIFAVSEQVANGAVHQAERAESASEMMADVSSLAEKVSELAQRANENAQYTLDITDEGNKVIQETVRGMNEVTENVLLLGEKSNRIGEIVDIIRDIAGQTNLLSLNAAIEAARAGDAGRGFAVVADEVRKLAERSAYSTKDISNLVKDIQLVTQKAVDSVSIGKKSTAKTESSFEAIREKVHETAEQVSQIAQAAEEQLKTSLKISAEVQDIAAISEESSAGAEQATGATQSLAHLAAELENKAAMYRI